MGPNRRAQERERAAARAAEEAKRAKAERKAVCLIHPPPLFGCVCFSNNLIFAL
jgi:hypothetical protein